MPTFLSGFETYCAIEWKDDIREDFRMEIMNYEINLQTRGDCDLADITANVSAIISESGIREGHVLLFVPGATGGLTTIEYENGLIRDFRELMERLIPQGARYSHDFRWGDGNGHSHLRAALIGPSLMVPIAAGQMTLGTWQQIIFIDFDNRARHRKLVVQVCGRQ